MKIQITAAAVGGAPPPVPAVLAGNVITEGPSGLRQNGRRLLQVTEKYRKTDVDVFDRKNVKNVFQFQVKRVFATIQEAELFNFDHEPSVPNVGLIEFITQADSGGGTTSRFMVGGVESIDLVEQRGANVTHAYTLVGGRILLTRP